MIQPTWHCSMITAVVDGDRPAALAQTDYFCEHLAGISQLVNLAGRSIASTLNLSNHFIFIFLLKTVNFITNLC